MSAIAWDILKPLTPYLRDTHTGQASEALLSLAIGKGKPREVLLVLVEAIETFSIDDNGSMDQDVHVLLTLLESEEKILQRISSNKPSRFLAEYTKSLLHAMHLVNGIASTDYYATIWRIISESQSSGGALSHLTGLGDTTDEHEKLAMAALLRSFYTYVAELCPMNDEYLHDEYLLCMHELDLQHPELIPPFRPPTESLPRASSIVRQIWDMYQFDRHSTIALFDCGSWAEQENSQDNAEEEGEVEIDNSLEVPLSPAGSAILLSRNVDRAQLRSVEWSNPLIQDQCRLMLIELCSKQTPNLTTLDSCLHLCLKCEGSIIDSSTSAESAVAMKANKLLYIQALSFISATCGNPGIRSVAHYLVRDVLKACTHQFRYEFYQGIFEDCPYEALKTVTIGMIKDEMANQADFWCTSERLERITSLIFVTHDLEDVATNDALFVAYWVQALNFLIFLLQQPKLLARRQVWAGAWLTGLDLRTRRSTHLSDLDLAVISLQIARARELVDKNPASTDP